MTLIRFNGGNKVRKGPRLTTALKYQFTIEDCNQIKDVVNEHDGAIHNAYATANAVSDRMTELTGLGPNGQVHETSTIGTLEENIADNGRDASIAKREAAQALAAQVVATREIADLRAEIARIEGLSPDLAALNPYREITGEGLANFGNLGMPRIDIDAPGTYLFHGDAELMIKIPDAVAGVIELRTTATANLLFWGTFADGASKKMYPRSQPLFLRWAPRNYLDRPGDAAGSNGAYLY